MEGDAVLQTALRSLSATASEILPGRLWVRARTNSLSLQAKERLWHKLQFTDVVCCCLIPDHQWDDDLGIDYWHERWSDSTRNLPPNLDEAADFYASQIELRGARLLLYCDSGRNRSALLAAKIVKRIMAVSGMKAIEIVRAGRPMALKNPFFVQHLRTAP